MTRNAAAAIMHNVELGVLDAGKINCISILGGRPLDDIDSLLDEEKAVDSLPEGEMTNEIREILSEQARRPRAVGRCSI